MTRSSENEIRRRGLRLREKMFGENTTQRQMDQSCSYSQKLQEIVTDHCFGDVWNRPQLSLRDRSLVTIAMLTVLEHTAELRIHIRGALSNGVQLEEIREVFLHSHMYGGIPVAFGAIRVAEQVFEEETGGR